MKWCVLALAVLLGGAQEPALEVFSIRPATRDMLPPGTDEEDPCSGAALRLAGRQLASTGATLHSLIALAFNPWKYYAGACAYATRSGLIAGGPSWIRTDRYVVQALLPEGTESAAAGLNTGDAPDVQRMLQAALAARFTLVVRQERREMPVYLLMIDQSPDAARARMSQSKAAAPTLLTRLPVGINSAYPTTADGGRYASIGFSRQPLVRLAQRLTAATAVQRPIVDRTGLAGEFDFVLEYDDTGVARPTLFTALREQLGLRLEPSRERVEVLVIERAERPTEN